jgi:hypothetical protein
MNFGDMTLNEMQEQLEQSLGIAESKVRQFQDQIPAEHLEKFNKELDRINELKEELNGLKNNK